MKRYLLIPMLLIAAAFSARAQEKNDNDVNEKFFEAQIREYVYQLELSDEQKAAFIPVYKRYSEALKATFTKREKPEAAPGERPEKGQKHKLTREEVVARLKARIEQQQKAQAVRLEFIDEFAEVLEPRQLMKVFQVEKEIQHKVKARQGGPQGGKGGQFHGGNGNRNGGFRQGGPRSQNAE